MKREEIYKEIDIEIDYSNKKWVDKNLKNGIVDKEQKLYEWVNYIQNHLSSALLNIINVNDYEALSELRKVVALGVTALEIYGCPSRIKNNNDLQKLDGDGC
jgi:hypothetical protein